MSGDRDRDPQRLARELAETPCAVPVLVTLWQRGGHAPGAALSDQCSAGEASDALRWLIATRLVRQFDPHGTLDLDSPDAVYTLTEIGSTLTRTLTELAQVLADTRSAEKVPAGTSEPRQ